MLFIKEYFAKFFFTAKHIPQEENEKIVELGNNF